MSQLGKPKTTTGCKTCKQRRVKCDEGRPSCARCLKAGRECAGYEPWRDLTHAKREPSPQSLFQRQAANAEEDLLFRVFLEDGARHSVAASDIQFWKILIPQLCEVEPSIKYATLAMGALMQQQRNIKAFSESGPDSKSALIYYNKSIKSLLSPNNPVSKDVALVSNLLFTCMECIQGRDSEAIGLFHQGRRMFEEHWSHQDRPSELMFSIRSFLSRVRLLALLYGPPMADYKSVITGEDETDEPFASYEHARLAFFYLVGEIHALISEASHARLAYTPQEVIIQTLSAEQHAMQTRLRSLKDRFMPLLEPALYATGNPSDQIAVLTLQVQIMAMGVWTACCLSCDECVWDMHIQTFTKIVDISDRIVDLLESEGIINQPFSMEIGLIAPLYISGRMCRDPAVRLKILKLLDRGRQQEGLWQAKQTGAILQRIYAIENAGKSPGDYLPAEAARLRATLVHPRKVDLSGKRGNPIQFLLMSEDPAQGWNVWEEFIEAP